MCCQDARRQGDGHNVVTGGPPQVLHHLPIACPAEGDDSRHVSWVAPDQHHIAGFNGDVGACADGDSDVRGEQRGRIVHAITHHGDPFALSLELLDLVHLVARQHLGKDRVDSEIRATALATDFASPVSITTSIRCSWSR